MKGCTRIDTKGMSRGEWLEQRKKSVGGSDAAAIVGLSNYASPYSVWADKTGRLPEKPDTEAMRQGRELEDYVARRWMEETHKRVKRINAMLYHPSYPFAHADVDRWVIGENAGLECKTTSTLNVKQFKGVEFPEQYYAQCVHYMAVTGADRWYLGALLFGREFLTYTLERDQAEIDALMEAEEAFWRLVQEDRPPSPDGSVVTTNAMQAVYEEGQAGHVQLFGREPLFQEYKMLLEQQKATMAQIRQIKQTLMLDLGECETGACGRFTVSWKQQKRAFVSREKLLDVYPKLNLSKVMRVSKYRRFQIQEERDAAN